MKNSTLYKTIITDGLDIFSKFTVILIFCVAFLTTSTRGQTIHALLFADTLDNVISDGCKQDLKHIRSFLTDLSTALGNPNYDEHLYLGKKGFTGKKFNGCVSDLKSNPDDIIFLYVSSHGDRSDKDLSEFPDITFPDGVFPAYSVFSKLLTLPHRTCIGVIDACNIFREATPGEIGFYTKSKAAPTPAYPAYNINPLNAKQLLLNKSFDLLITSSQSGVYSITNQNGSVFTASLIKGFEYLMSLNDNSLVYMDNALQKIQYLSLIEANRQISYGHNTARDPKSSPPIPIWRICPSHDFPCDPGMYLTGAPPDFLAISLRHTLGLETEALSEVAYEKKSGSMALSFEGQSKDVDLKRYKLDVAIEANRQFDWPKRFKSQTVIGRTDSLILSSYQKDPLLSYFVRDVNPSQFIINYQAVRLTDSLKKKFNTDKNFLVTINVLAPENILKEIDDVEYFQDPNLPNPVIVSRDRSEGFSANMYLADNFYLIAKINFLDKTNTEVGQQLIVNK